MDAASAHVWDGLGKPACWFSLSATGGTSRPGAPRAGPAEDEPDRPIESAIRHRRAHLRFLGVAGGVLALDLWTKKWVFQTLAPHEGRPILAHTFELRRSLNDGAVFGSFTGNVSLFMAASLFALGFVFYLFAHSRPEQRWLHVALACILAGALGNLYDRAFQIADVVSYRNHAGREATLIGRIISRPGDRMIVVGDWPEGVSPGESRPRSFVASEVGVHQQGVVRDFIKFVPKFPAKMPFLGGYDVWPWVFNIADASLVCGVGTMLITCWSGRKQHRKTAGQDP